MPVRRHARRLRVGAEWPYAVDLVQRPQSTVTQWEAKGANVAGTAGPTFGTDGNLFVATDGGATSSSNDANAVVALDPQTLKPKDWFSPGKTAVHGIARRLSA